MRLGIVAPQVLTAPPTCVSGPKGFPISRHDSRWCAKTCSPLAEEILDASRIVPIAMITSTVMEAVLGLVSVTTYCFAISNIEKAMSDPRLPFIDVIFHAVGSLKATNVMLSYFAVMAFFGGVASLAAASRQLFAFSRDGGFPFHTVFAKVRLAFGHFSTPTFGTATVSLT